MKPNNTGSSFRDPNGYLFWQDERLYRYVDYRYKDHYDGLMSSGLYQSLVDKHLLVRHEEIDSITDTGAYKIIAPQMVPFISYPYEWSFSQLKQAALTTLRIQREALDANLVLKDASAYNVQFLEGKPIFIDSLSFERYEEGAPWIAYRQFCQHFLAPLTLMSYVDVRLGQLLRIYIDGIPLDLTSKLLPTQTYLRIAPLFHVHLHARSSRRYSGRQSTRKQTMPKLSLVSLIDNLDSFISHLKWKPEGTDWSAYYQDNSYTPDAFAFKKETIEGIVDRIKPGRVWDVGANTGVFSRIASSRSIPTVAWDIDPGAVELNYKQVSNNNETHLLPLVLDLTNPSPEIGWNLQERDSVLKRGPVDMVFALALIHHLSITNRVPLDMVAGFFAGLTRHLVIEFVPKDDPKTQILLAGVDNSPDYSQENFEAAFSRYFTIQQKWPIRDSLRTLYLMECR